MLPLLFAGGLGSFVAGGISQKLNNVSISFIAGSALIVLGSGLLSTLSASQYVQHKLLGFQVPLGFGIGMIFSSVSVAVSLRVESRYQSICQGIASQSRLLGGSLGVAAANAVTNREIHLKLNGVLSPAQISGLQFSTTGLATLNVTQKEAVRSAYANAWEETMRVCVYVASVAFLLSLFTIESASQKHKGSNDSDSSREKVRAQNV